MWENKRTLPIFQMLEILQKIIFQSPHTIYWTDFALSVTGWIILHWRLVQMARMEFDLTIVMLHEHMRVVKNGKNSHQTGCYCSWGLSHYTLKIGGEVCASEYCHLALDGTNMYKSSHSFIVKVIMVVEWFVFQKCICFESEPSFAKCLSAFADIKEKVQVNDIQWLRYYSKMSGFKCF